MSILAAKIPAIGAFATWAQAFTMLAVRRGELSAFPAWRTMFTSSRKDHRYYEILDETLRDRFDYGYFVISDGGGEARAIQPYFVLDQDLLEGVGAAAAPAALVRSAFPRFMRQRTLMVGCVAGEGHLAGCDSLPVNEVAEVLATHLVPAAKALDARMIVLKEFPAHYRGALAALDRTGFARVPSMPMTTMDVAHASFDEYMTHRLRSHGRRHLKQNLAASSGIDLRMDVAHDVTPILEEVYALYLQVFGRAKMKFEKLTIDFLRLLGERMSDKMRFFTWRRGKSLVAFSMSMSEGDVLYIEYIGLDYSIALDAHLYYAMFRDEYNWAVRNGYRTIRSSGLSYDPKLHLRFDLYPIDLYVRHVSPLANAALARLLPRLVPAAYDPMLRKFANYGDIW